MDTNVIKKNDLPILNLLTDDIRQLLEICGYNLDKEDLTYSELINWREGKLLRFQINSILYRQKTDGAWSTVFSCHLPAGLNEVNMALMLWAVDAIDLSKVKEFQELLTKSFLDIKERAAVSTAGPLITNSKATVIYGE